MLTAPRRWLPRPLAVRASPSAVGATAAGLLFAGAVLAAAGYLTRSPAPEPPDVGIAAATASAAASPSPWHGGAATWHVRQSVRAPGATAVPARDGPAPGQTGPAAIYGHVDTAAAGPAVFFRLGDLTPGDTIDVTRADRSIAVFTVYRIAEYAKDAFPTMTVYGDTPDAELRLITCGGDFDPATGSYLDNIVAYARLTSARPDRSAP